MPKITRSNLKRGAIGITIGAVVGELAIPLIYRLAGKSHGRFKKLVYRYAPKSNKEVAITILGAGFFTGNPALIGAGTGMVLADVHEHLRRDKRSIKEYNRAIKNHPAIDVHYYDIPDWLPVEVQYNEIGKKLKEIVTETTYNRVRRVNIPAGREHPAVVIKARKIIKQNGLDGHNKPAVLQALQRWIQQNINYSFDPRYRDMFFHPYQLLISGVGDCDCQALLLASMGEAVGIPMRFRLISQFKDTPSRYNHIFSEGEVSPGKWVPAETIFPMALGWTPPFTNSKIVSLE